MTQTFLFLLVVAIGLGYARKYGDKAKKDVEEYEKKKKREDQEEEMD